MEIRQISLHRLFEEWNIHNMMHLEVLARPWSSIPVLIESWSFQEPVMSHIPRLSAAMDLLMESILEAWRKSRKEAVR